MAIASEHIDSVILRASTKLGYSSLRENQLKAVKSFIEGNDVFKFVILPTGSGKSLCFWLLPFAFDYLYERVGTIVIGACGPSLAHIRSLHHFHTLCVARREGQ